MEAPGCLPNDISFQSHQYIKRLPPLARTLNDVDAREMIRKNMRLHGKI